MQLEFHQLDRRLAHLRAQRPERQRRLLASLAASGQQTPIVVVAVAQQKDRYLVIDGYQRIAALEQLGRDTVESVIWPMGEGEAVVLDRTLRFSPRESALEEGWLLAELEQRCGYGMEELAQRLDRSLSWVSRRLALVELIPESVQQQVREGKIAAAVAVKFLAPVARSSPQDCERMAQAWVKHRFTVRQAGQLYAAWRDAAASVRQRILEQPELFLKAQQQVEPHPPPTAGNELLRDLDMVAAIANRASRRLKGITAMDRRQCVEAQHKINQAVHQLRRVAEKISVEEHEEEKGHQHVEPSTTDSHSGTAEPGREQTRDRTDSGAVPSHGTQSPGFELGPSARVAPAGEGRTLSPTHSGTVSAMQTESGPSP